MKKLNLLLGIIIGLSIFSCASDDNNSNPKNDLIIGIWKPISLLNNYDGVEKIEEWPCGDFITYTYSINGDFTYTSYDSYSNNICVQKDNYLVDGSWQKLQGNNYRLITDYDNPNTNLKYDTIDNTNEIIFPDNNTMIFIHNYDTNQISYTISSTFIRIK